jgi:hypothetical protein
MTALALWPSGTFFFRLKAEATSPDSRIPNPDPGTLAPWHPPIPERVIMAHTTKTRVSASNGYHAGI